MLGCDKPIVDYFDGKGQFHIFMTTHKFGVSARLVEAFSRTHLGEILHRQQEFHQHAILAATVRVEHGELQRTGSLLFGQHQTLGIPYRGFRIVQAGEYLLPNGKIVGGPGVQTLCFHRHVRIGNPIQESFYFVGGGAWRDKDVRGVQVNVNAPIVVGRVEKSLINVGQLAWNTHNVSHRLIRVVVESLGRGGNVATNGTAEIHEIVHGGWSGWWLEEDLLQYGC